MLRCYEKSKTSWKEHYEETLWNKIRLFVNAGKAKPHQSLIAMTKTIVHVQDRSNVILTTALVLVVLIALLGAHPVVGISIPTTGITTTKLESQGPIRTDVDSVEAPTDR